MQLVTHGLASELEMSKSNFEEVKYNSTWQFLFSSFFFLL